MCTIPGKEHLPANSPDCTETPPVVTVSTPPTPTTLPETGIVESVASILGLGSIMAAGSYYFVSRKQLLSALLNR
jgi:LPXTG-motif cell wall-anchored protein